MNRQRLFLPQTLLTGTLTALLLLAGYPIDFAQAQGRPLGAPRGANKSGGTRSSCLAVDQARVLTALVDESDPALTTTANPTFLFYSPFGQNVAPSGDNQVNIPTTAEFELKDVDENSVLKHEKIIVSLPENPGLIKLKLPKTEAILEPNKEYFWILRVICDANNNAANPSVSGWIKRVTPNSSKNIWFDDLAQLTLSRTNQSQQWETLLKQFQLQDLAQAPIVELKPKAADNNIVEGD